MVLKERRAIPPRTGVGFEVLRGRLIKVIDSNGSIAAGKGSDLHSNLFTFMSKRGEYVLFEARMDMMVSLSASIEFEIWGV